MTIAYALHPSNKEEYLRKLSSQDLADIDQVSLETSDYFKDFMTTCLKSHSYNQCQFYVEIKSRTKERVVLLRINDLNPIYIESGFRLRHTKWLFKDKLTENINPLNQKIHQVMSQILTDKMRTVDFADIYVHVRLMGDKIFSLSSKIMHLQIDKR